MTPRMMTIRAPFCLMRGTKLQSHMNPLEIPMSVQSPSVEIQASAKIAEHTLSDGRVVLQIEHELLRGVTPAMLVWWWRNIEGDMELKGLTYPRYLIWHPIDHIHFEVSYRSWHS